MPDPIKFPARHPGIQRAEFRDAARNEQEHAQQAADYVAESLRIQHALRAVRDNSLAEGRQAAQAVLVKQGFFQGFVAGILCTVLLSVMVVGDLAQWALRLVKS